MHRLPKARQKTNLQSALWRQNRDRSTDINRPLETTYGMVKSPDVWMHSPVAMRQIRIVLSLEPDATSSESCENATDVTGRSWPGHGNPATDSQAPSGTTFCSVFFATEVCSSGGF